MFLNEPFCVGFNWFCTPLCWPLSVSEVSHSMLVMLLTISNCCYSYEYEVPLFNIPVHYCLCSTGWLKIQYFWCFIVFLIRWDSGNIYIFRKKCVQIPLIVILRFLIKIICNGTVNFKVSVDTFLLYEYCHKVIHTICERIYMTFIIRGFAEQFALWILCVSYK